MATAQIRILIEGTVDQLESAVRWVRAQTNRISDDVQHLEITMREPEDWRERIIQTVCEEFSIPRHMVLGKRRLAHVAVARHAVVAIGAIYLDGPSLSVLTREMGVYGEIGSTFWALRQSQARYDTDASYRLRFDECLRRLGLPSTTTTSPSHVHA